MMLVLNDVAHNIHAKTSSFAYGFGGEEVLKEFLFHFIRHTDTIVNDHDDAVILLLADMNGDLGLVVVWGTM